MSNDTDRDRLSGIQQRPGGSAAAGAEATLGGPRSPPVDMELSPTAKTKQHAGLLRNKPS
jgi:hypothetical protein